MILEMICVKLVLGENNFVWPLKFQNMLTSKNELHLGLGALDQKLSTIWKSEQHYLLKAEA